ncbi:MAG: VCBS repeat-containing protein, partial [Acidobacteria bacterium]|nr:VCBS repeat-containing protein [Acidobacteriota bacterium]
QGLLWMLQHQGDPRRPWKAIKIDALTTSHHVGWADVDGDGKKELINAPLIGPQALAPRYEDRVPLVYYRIPKDWTSEWKRETIDDQLTGVLHRLRPVHWDGGKREQILTAGFDGIVLHQASGTGDKLRWENKLLARGHEEAPPRAGASDVRLGHLNKRRFLAAVEPWHGNEVVVYTEDAAGRWQRRVIFSELVEGHEVALGDFNGNGRDDIVAGDRGKGASVHVFYAQDDRGEKWDHHVIDRGGMAASGCATADLNADGRVDIVCIGAATSNLKWYENVAPARR